MKQVADGVWQLSGGLPFNGINIYVVDDVLVDAGTRHAARRITRQLDGHALSAHVLTHAHPDHQGASHEICTRYDIPYWVGANDIDAAENPALIGERQPSNPIAQFFFRTMHGPGHKVDRALREGDEVASFRVIDAPGHSAGHIALWRDDDGVLICGDVLVNLDIFTGIPRFGLPKDLVTPDVEQNRRSARKLLELDPKLILFGHGAPLRDKHKFARLRESLSS